MGSLDEDENAGAEEEQRQPDVQRSAHPAERQPYWVGPHCDLTGGGLVNDSSSARNVLKGPSSLGSLHVVILTHSAVHRGG